MKKIISGLLLALGCMSMQASAHLIYFAYDDLGNGTVDFYAQHYHPITQTTGSGFKFTDTTNSANFYTAIWNDTIASTSIDTLVGLGTFSQTWDLAVGHASYNDSYTGNWLVARGVSLANGIYNVSTVSPTAVDTPWTPLPQITVSNVTVPEPSTLAVLALGLLGLASRRTKRS